MHIRSRAISQKRESLASREFPRPAPHVYFFSISQIHLFHHGQYADGLSDNVGPNQLCSIVGSGVGQNSVSGSAYMNAGYSYSSSHIWRNVSKLLFCLIDCDPHANDSVRYPSRFLALLHGLANSCCKSSPTLPISSSLLFFVELDRLRSS